MALSERYTTCSKCGRKSPETNEFFIGNEVLCLPCKREMYPVSSDEGSQSADEDRLKAFEILLNGAFSISLNMNDTFAFACADVEEMSVSDFDLMVPVISKYGQDALTAYAAVKRNQEPISCKCDHKNERYQAAKVEIKKIKEAKPDFMES